MRKSLMQCLRISRTLCSAFTQTLSIRTPSSLSLKWTGGSILTCTTSTSSSPLSTKSLLKPARSNIKKWLNRPYSRARLISTSRNYMVIVTISILAHTGREAPCQCSNSYLTQSITANLTPIETTNLSHSETSTLNNWTKQEIISRITQSSLRTMSNSCHP